MSYIGGKHVTMQVDVRDWELPCRSDDPELWFAESPADVERAKRLCRGCPVRVACLDGALARREFCGVWGGEILQRGAVIRRKRRRGRPRKDEVGAANSATSSDVTNRR